MGVVVVMLIQGLIAFLVAGLVLPAILFAVPSTRTMGPGVLVIVVGVLFVLLRLAWPQRKAP